MNVGVVNLWKRNKKTDGLRFEWHPSGFLSWLRLFFTWLCVNYNNNKIVIDRTSIFCCCCWGGVGVGGLLGGKRSWPRCPRRHELLLRYHTNSLLLRTLISAWYLFGHWFGNQMLTSVIFSTVSVRAINNYWGGKLGLLHGLGGRLNPHQTEKFWAETHNHFQILHNIQSA